MIRHSWPLLLAAVTFISACGPDQPQPDGGTPAEDAGFDAGVDAGTDAGNSPTCHDDLKNGDETGVDCGGSCDTRCALGETCSADTDCNSGICSAGVCVQCTEASQCPGSDSECQVRTCTNNTCGVSNVEAGTPVASQTAGDCKVEQCDGNGAIVSANDDADVPDDGNDCTDDVCTAGVASHPAKAVDTACSQNGGGFCDGSGACVACNTADQCPGSDTECQVRTCINNTCGVSNMVAGTPVASQTAGDCRVEQCDGNGAVESANDDSDLPVDGNECTEDVCTSGVPSNPAAPVNTVCSQNGGLVCDGIGACVGCTSASQCPGNDNECHTRTCTSGACGFDFATAGTPVAAQTAGDCKVNQCDGAGNVISANDDNDLPADDGNACTAEACTMGTVSHTPVAAGTACNENGDVCDASGQCISAPNVASTVPADNTVVAATGSLSITFTTAMNPATITGQTSAGACSGSVQVSADNFASCVAFSTAAAVMSNGDTVAKFTPAPGLLLNRTYKIRVTTAAQGAGGQALSSTFTQASGFGTVMPGIVVISQVYSAGGNTGATYKNDFVELHNRGGAAVNLAGMSLQYAANNGTTWNNTVALNGTIPPGGYFLVQLTGGTVGAALPAPDQTGNIAMGAAGGKIALLSTTSIASGSCPPAASTLDFVGFGTANCAEGPAAPAPTTTNTIFRAADGCQDTNFNNVDFAIAPVSPRNSASPAVMCLPVTNETDHALEADFCSVQNPLSLTVQTGTNTGDIYGQIFETGVTETAGASATVLAQLGYGPVNVNPQYQSGWTWSNATYNVQDGNNDEYKASFTAPAVGTYRYGYRFSLDKGVSWTYCDAAQGDLGAGSGPGLTFSLDDLPLMQVTP